MQTDVLYEQKFRLFFYTRKVRIQRESPSYDLVGY